MPPHTILQNNLLNDILIFVDLCNTGNIEVCNACCPQLLHFMIGETDLVVPHFNHIIDDHANLKKDYMYNMQSGW